METAFGIETLEVDGSVRVRASGELDIATAGQVESALAAIDPPPGCTQLLLDLRNITFIDSSGVRVIVQASKALDSRLSILAGPACKRLFDLAGVASCSS